MSGYLKCYPLILNSSFEKIKHYENPRAEPETRKVIITMEERGKMVMTPKEIKKVGMTTEVERKVTQNVSRHISVFVNVIRFKRNDLSSCRLHLQFEISKDLETKEIFFGTSKKMIFHLSQI